MQKIRIEWMLSLSEKMQVCSRFPRTKKELPSEFEIQNKIMWCIYKRRMLSLRGSM